MFIVPIRCTIGWGLPTENAAKPESQPSKFLLGLIADLSKEDQDKLINLLRTTITTGLLLTPVTTGSAAEMPRPTIGAWCTFGQTKRDGNWNKQAYNPGPTEVCVGDLMIERDNFGWEDLNCKVVSQRQESAATGTLWIVAARCKDYGGGETTTDIFKFLKHKKTLYVSSQRDF